MITETYDKWAELRALCLKVAVEEFERRRFTGNLGVMGVHLLVFKVRKSQAMHGSKVEDPDTVRRRFNELADSRITDPPKLVCVGTFLDTKPNEFPSEKTRVVKEPQSSYSLNPVVYPEYATLIAEAERRARFEMKHGQNQNQLFA